MEDVKRVVESVIQFKEDVIETFYECYECSCINCHNLYSCNLHKALCALEEAAFFLEQELVDRQ